MKKLIPVVLILLILLSAGCSDSEEEADLPYLEEDETAEYSASTPADSAGNTVRLVSNSTVQTTSVRPSSSPTPSLKLEKYDGGFFTIQKPAGWDIVTAGYGSTLAFCLRDPANPANQIFYFNEIGPVYLADEQKLIDQDYMSMGGFPIQYIEMPVINPLTPENFLSQYHLITRTDIARQFMPQAPVLNDVQIISSGNLSSPLPGGQTQLLRALFKEGSVLGEGLFYITTAELFPLSGVPGGGIGYGFCVTGISAEKSLFQYYQPALTESLNSLYISQSYIDECMRQQQSQYEGILKAGQTLSETSDLIYEGWQNRNKTDDIMAEKRSDAILSNERVYDPDSGTVYEVPLGFYDQYDTNRQQYNMSNLQSLPENNWDLWTAPRVSGDSIN